MEETTEVVKQFVVFRLLNEDYGIDIQKVTTIEQIKPIARVPKTPQHIRGVINLRGDIIPIMDLRSRFNLPVEEETEESRIIIIKTEETSIGIIVDSVAEVLNLNEEAIENVSGFSKDLDMDYIIGVGKADDRIVTLLNIENLVKMDSMMSSI